MSAANTATAYHISPRDIKSWGDFSAANSTSRHKVGLTGKPIGFWYAYDTAWSNLLKPNTTEKHTYRLPLHGFTTDVYYPSPSKILKLSKDNLYEFVDVFHKPEYFKDPCVLLDSLVFQAVAEGDSALSLVIPAETLEELKEKALEGEGGLFSKGGSRADCANFVASLIDKWSTSEYASDLTYIQYYDWEKFWTSVAEKYAGVEFDADLMYPREGDFIWTEISSGNAKSVSYKLHVTWLRLLDIVSGCIFHPETYFSEKPSELKVIRGGSQRSRTRRSRSLLRPAPQRRSDSGRLLDAVPRRLSATRRSRARI